MKRYYIFFALLAAVSITVVVAQTLVNRPVQADRKLADRLRATNEQINMYVSRQSSLSGAKLPQSLNELEGDHAGITYKRKSDQLYELCATFQTKSQSRKSGPELMVPSSYIDPSDHPKGYHCFSGTAESYGKPADMPVRQ